MEISKETKILALCLLPVLFIMVLHYHMTGFVIYNDGINYYNYLRSGIIDGDLNFTNEWQFYNQSYSKFSNESRGLNYIEVRTPNGYLDNIHLIGNAILWIPFFLLAHLSSLLFGIEANGYTFLYEGSIGLATLVYGFFGMLLIYRFCRNFYDEKISMISTIAVWYGTSVFWYFAVEPSMAHINSLFLVALFVNLWWISRKKRDEITWITIGAFLGLIFLVRQQDILIGLLLAFDLYKDWFENLGKRIESVAYTTLGFFVILLPQIFIWNLFYGKYLVFSYGNYAGQTGLWHWQFPDLFNFFFSVDYGMVFNVGIFFIGLIGLIILTLKNRKSFNTWKMVLFIVFLQIVITSAWSSWTSGYGLRFLLGLSIFFALGLCEMIKIRGKVFHADTTTKYLIYFMIALLILFNFLDMWRFL